VLTARGWWALFVGVAMLFFGIASHVTALTATGLAITAWVSIEWLLFALRVRQIQRRARALRVVRDRRGPVTALCKGRRYTVEVRVEMDDWRLGQVLATDAVPFAVRHLGGSTRVDGPLGAGEVLSLSYDIECPQAGRARFEGLRIEATDLQGLCAHVTFLRAPVEMRVLPASQASRSGLPLIKKQNALPPPGTHRLRKAGTGTELLELRDYQPGDPPRTIAWKVSARRGKLMTRDFESEVPVRVVLFLDAGMAARSTCLADGVSGDESRGSFRLLDRLIDLAASALAAFSASRDLTGLVVFDEEGYREVRPGRGGAHTARLTRALSDAASLGPRARKADPEALLPVAHALAREVYPDLLRQEVNQTPWWLTWLVGHPGASRHPRGWQAWLDRRKRLLVTIGALLVPAGLTLAGLASFFLDLSDSARAWLLAALAVGIPASAALGWLTFTTALAAGGGRRRLFQARKQVSALLAVLLGLPAGALQRLLEDDDYLSEKLQQLLESHRVPYALPLLGPDGSYLLDGQPKARSLSRAHLRAVAAARDNELHVFLADLLGMEGGLGTVLGSIKVALARHHQVVVICPWPEGLPGPDSPRKPGEGVAGKLEELIHQRLSASFARLRRELSRLGVQALLSTSGEAIPALLEKAARLRASAPGPGGAR
jgi:uncharacterized protein (DUF58 family)